MVSQAYSPTQWGCPANLSITIFGINVRDNNINGTILATAAQLVLPVLDHQSDPGDPCDVTLPQPVCGSRYGGHGEACQTITDLGESARAAQKEKGGNRRLPLSYNAVMCNTTPLCHPCIHTTTGSPTEPVHVTYPPTPPLPGAMRSVDAASMIATVIAVFVVVSLFVFIAAIAGCRALRTRPAGESSMSLLAWRPSYDEE